MSIINRPLFRLLYYHDLRLVAETESQQVVKGRILHDVLRVTWTQRRTQKMMVQTNPKSEWLNDFFRHRTSSKMTRGYYRAIASYPGREGEGEKWPGTFCTCMRQHFRHICRKIVRITQSKHVVMPWKKMRMKCPGNGKSKSKQNLLPSSTIAETP